MSLISYREKIIYWRYPIYLKLPKPFQVKDILDGFNNNNYKSLNLKSIENNFFSYFVLIFILYFIHYYRI